ncbi:hypothetical protein PM082_013645 [Marasmius tenuissimus]|nr:hypothetical protein PM082_013645 [Marasmius tenuissimus]
MNPLTGVYGGGLKQWSLEVFCSPQPIHLCSERSSVKWRQAYQLERVPGTNADMLRTEPY